MRLKKIIGIFGCISAMGINIALADTVRGYPNSPDLGRVLKPHTKTITIRNNSGGNVARFAIRAASMERSGTNVRFAGRCDSACTLYLGLPRSQTCISPGAFFRFHAPTARSARAAGAAQRFMYARYPGWVRSWIAAKGGMTRQLITMDYAYASNFIKQC